MANNENNELTDFLTYLYAVGSESTTEEELQNFYKENIDIEFNHHKISIPFDAVSYNALVKLIETVKEEL